MTRDHELIFSLVPEPSSPPIEISDRFQDPCSIYECPDGAECVIHPVSGNPYCKCNRFNAFPDVSIKCVRDCEEDEDCFSAEKCVTDNELNLNTCKDVCTPGTICGENSYCVPDFKEPHSPKCQCKKGYQKAKNATALNGCTAIPLDSSDEIQTSYCTPTNCGPNSRCSLKNGKSVCTCQIDAAGVPPNCKKICSVESDCPLIRKCSPEGVCINVCNESSCGENVSHLL